MPVNKAVITYQKVAIAHPFCTGPGIIPVLQGDDFAVHDCAIMMTRGKTEIDVTKSVFLNYDMAVYHSFVPAGFAFHVDGARPTLIKRVFLNQTTDGSHIQSKTQRILAFIIAVDGLSLLYAQVCPSFPGEIPSKGFEIVNS